MKNGAIKQTTPVTYGKKKWGYKTDHPGNVCHTYTSGRHTIDVMY